MLGIALELGDNGDLAYALLGENKVLSKSSHSTTHTKLEHTHTHRVCNTFSLSAVALWFSSLTEIRQMLFLTLPPSHPLISFAFSSAPVCSSLVQSEEGECVCSQAVCAVLTAACGPVAVSTELTDPCSWSAQWDHAGAVREVFPSLSCFWSADSLIFPLPSARLVFWDNHSSNYPELF